MGEKPRAHIVCSCGAEVTVWVTGTGIATRFAEDHKGCINKVKPQRQLITGVPNV